MKIFLEHGGNPTSPNGREETCLHSICRRGDNPRLRLEIMEMLLEWRGEQSSSLTTGGKSSGDEDSSTSQPVVEVLGEPEMVSINHADLDGNGAVHYAAASGLVDCVDRLVSQGAIISLVNKAQKTCCELADAEQHTVILPLPNPLALLRDPNPYLTPTKL